MGNDLQVFNNPEFGEVRVIGDAENPLFCLSDVCKALALRVDGVVARLKGDPITAGVISNHPITDRLGRTQNAYFVNEDGLYDVILDSRKPEAKKMRKWLTHEVVPSIRKTGMYINPNAPIDPNFLRRIADELEGKDRQITALTAEVNDRDEKIAVLQPKADYTDKVLLSDEPVAVTVIAKEYGMSGTAFNKLLHSERIQYLVGATWILYQPYARRGYTITKTVFDSNDNPRVHTYWTQAGRKFLYHFLQARGIVPLRERTESQLELF